jgi:hypothetical protein
VSTPSRPLLIGLLVTLAIAGVYFVALKPPGKGADSNSQFNAPISNAQKAVVQSQVAAAQAQRAADNAGSTTPAVTPKPVTPVVTAKPAVPVHPAVKHTATTVKHTTTTVKHTATATQPVVVKHTTTVTHAPAIKHTSNVPKLASWDKSGKIFNALAHGNVAVLLFWTKGGSDDNSVRRAVQSVSKRKHVSTFVVPMSDVGKYEAVTSQFEVTVSPTVLVFGRKDQFIPIIGYTTAPTINQYINSVR